MTVVEMQAIRALRSVRMPSKNWHARCVVRLCLEMEGCPGRKLGITEECDLWFLVWRYRRQISDKEVLARADEIVNGALHLAI